MPFPPRRVKHTTPSWRRLLWWLNGYTSETCVFHPAFCQTQLLTFFVKSILNIPPNSNNSLVFFRSYKPFLLGNTFKKNQEPKRWPCRWPLTFGQVKLQKTVAANSEVLRTLTVGEAVQAKWSRMLVRCHNVLSCFIIDSLRPKAKSGQFVCFFLEFQQKKKYQQKCGMVHTCWDQIYFIKGLDPNRSKCLRSPRRRKKPNSRPSGWESGRPMARGSVRSSFRGQTSWGKLDKSLRKSIIT